METVDAVRSMEAADALACGASSAVEPAPACAELDRVSDANFIDDIIADEESVDPRPAPETRLKRVLRQLGARERAEILAALEAGDEGVHELLGRFAQESDGFSTVDDRGFTVPAQHVDRSRRRVVMEILDVLIDAHGDRAFRRRACQLASRSVPIERPRSRVTRARARRAQQISTASAPEVTDSPPSPSGGDAPSLLDEELLRLGDAARLARVSAKTVRRWIHVGRNGRRLEAIKLGGQLRTSREALERFALFPAADVRAPSCPDGSALQRHRRAERELDRLLGPSSSPSSSPSEGSSPSAEVRSTNPVRARKAPRRNQNNGR